MVVSGCGFVFLRLIHLAFYSKLKDILFKINNVYGFGIFKVRIRQLSCIIAQMKWSGILYTLKFILRPLLPNYIQNSSGHAISIFWYFRINLNTTLWACEQQKTPTIKTSHRILSVPVLCKWFDVIGAHDYLHECFTLTRSQFKFIILLLC